VFSPLPFTLVVGGRERERGRKREGERKKKRKCLESG
jgi:hypothetical protein